MMKGRAGRLSNWFKGHGPLSSPLLSSPLLCLDLSCSETGKFTEEKYLVEIQICRAETNITDQNIDLQGKGCWEEKFCWEDFCFFLNSATKPNLASWLRDGRTDWVTVRREREREENNNANTLQHTGHTWTVLCDDTNGGDHWGQHFYQQSHQ